MRGNGKVSSDGIPTQAISQMAHKDEESDNTVVASREQTYLKRIEKDSTV